MADTKKVKFVNDTTWQGKDHKADSTASLPIGDANELVFLGAAVPADSRTNPSSSTSDNPKG